MTDLITVRNLSKSFTMPACEVSVLNGIDLTFASGEIVSIVGASGAGKSTFLHILGTLDTPTSGSVTFHIPWQRAEQEEVNPFSLGGEDLSVFRNRAIGFVFQFHHLLPEFSALENVMMPGFIGRMRGHAGAGKIRDHADDLLTQLGLGNRLHHKPGELSGGEQQRVAVARALVNRPRVMLADEPTGNLDTKTGEELFAVLERLNRELGITIILVTHNESLATRCHRRLQMADGKLLNS
ncbi:MAG: lipoprotein-releasing system ATP-binding protein [Nitrospirae bacterium]|nr:MAG: lipoprotein-releasing system ATP-binding protein [Nitrospirota bacterium]